ncbi:unnamed protein product [Leuciscus chuanchicus]
MNSFRGHQWSKFSFNQFISRHPCTLSVYHGFIPKASRLPNAGRAFLCLVIWKGFGCTLKRIPMELSEESSGQEQENLRFSDNTVLSSDPEPYTTFQCPTLGTQLSHIRKLQLVSDDLY